jgi:hypothetical protein
MILGFAHITRNEPYWVPGLTGTHLPNAPEKWPLMERQATSQLLRLSEFAGLTVEVSGYDTGVVEQPSRLNVKVDVPCVSARDYGSELEFLREGLGFRVVGAAECGRSLHYKLGLESINPGWRVGLGIDADPDAPIDPPLDIAGYAALAFYSSDVEADRDHLLKHGGRTPTEPFTVKLDREMKIVMLRSPEGTIIELIQVMP